jgi:hypothetical protein
LQLRVEWEYLLEELGISASLSDTLQLSIGLLESYQQELSRAREGKRGAVNPTPSFQHTIFLMWPYME